MEAAGAESRRVSPVPLETRPGGGPTERFPPVIVEFGSADELMHFIRREPVRWPPDPDSQKTVSSPDDVEFNGTATWNQASDLVIFGWPQGERLLVEASSEHPPAEYAKERSVTYDVAGAIPDVPRFVAGDLFCMLDWTQAERGRQKLLKVVVSPMCDNTVTQRSRANWGAALLSWMEAEARAGYSIQLEVIYVSTPSLFFWDDKKLGPNVIVKFLLKRSDEHLSLRALSFWLMHNAAHRRVQFAIRERLDVGKWYAVHRVYGDAVTDPAEISRHCDPDSLLLILGNGAASVAEGLDYIHARVEERRRRTDAAGRK